MKKSLIVFIMVLAIVAALALAVIVQDKKTIHTEPVSIATSDEADETDAPGKFDLKILYAGLPETERANDFMDFLGKHFEEVTFTDYNSFDEKERDDFDVLILDHDGTETQAPTPTISREFSRATVTMGVPGGDISSRLGLKTGYL